jgi:CheY-like chemotaxis protein
MEGKTILVVEDEPIIALGIKETLERLGYRVPAPIAAGEEVLAAAGRLKPDMVLMDIRLSGFQDGIETARLLSAESEIPVVFLSAHSDDAMIKRASGANAYGFLVKPFDDRDLKTTIELAFARSAEDRRRLLDSYRARFGTILDELDEPIVVCDALGVVTYANRGGVSFLGYRVDGGLPGPEVARLFGKGPPWSAGESMPAVAALTEFKKDGRGYSASWSPLWGPGREFLGALIRIRPSKG